MKTKNPLALLGALLAATLGPAGAADAATGSVAGRVSNQATRAHLEGAEVSLQPTGQTTRTARDGNFEFPDLPAGVYNLTVSYAGLDAQTVAVTVETGRRAVRDVALTSGIYLLDALVVSGEREGNAESVQLQRLAPNVKNVLSSDAFGNIADENIGNFLTRIPGISGEVLEGQVTYIKIRGVDSDLNSVTVDGTRGSNASTRTGLNRALEIDTIPADFVDRIEVTKAPTPDMDADSIGGSVNLKTKSAFNQRGRVVTYRTGLSYGTARKTLVPQAGFMFADTFGRDRNLGVMVTGSFAVASNPRDVIFGAWEPTLATDRPAYFTLSSAGEDFFEHKRGGLGVRFDYRLSQRASIYLNILASQNHDRMFRRRNSFTGINAAAIVPGFTNLVTDTRNHGFGLAQVDRWRGGRTQNIHLGGEFDLRGAKIDYNLNYSPSRGYEKRTNTTPTVAGVGFRFDRGATMDDPAGATFRQISGPDITNPASFVLPSVGFTDDNRYNRMIGGHANARKTLALKLPVTVQSGVRFRMEDPRLVSRPTTYNYVGPGGAALGRFFDRGYVYQPEALRGTMPSVRFLHIPTVVYEWATRPEYFTLNRVTTLRNQLTNDRNASESVYAAYAMARAQLGRTEVLTGIRGEETHVQGTGTFQFISPQERARRAVWVGTVTEEENLRRTQAEFGNRVTNRSTYRNWFPGVHLRHELAPRFQARASFSTGIGRPSFGTIIPNNSVNDQTQVVTANNTSLRPQRGDNYDVSLEYYLRPAGLISAGLFQKDIRDFIFSSDTGVVGTGTENGFNGDYAGYRLVTQANAGSARVRGVELNFQHQFTNLPGFWRGFSFYANHTWLETRGDYGPTLGAARSGVQVPGFIPQVGNWGLSYIDRRWTVRVQHNFNSRNMAALNANLAAQQFNYGKRKVDFNVAYRLDPRLAFYADVINLLGEPIGGNPYVYVPGRKRGADKFTPEIKFGVNGRF